MTVAQDANAALVAYREIKSRILDLRYAAGEKLSETRLVAELGVGRSPIRTALARLKSEGWVAVSPQSGTYVTSPSDKEIEEVTELRTLLEMHVTRVATPRIPERELREMRAAFEALRRQPMALHLEDFLELDNLVHSAIYRAADNALIIGIVSNLLDKVQWIRRANSVSVARFELALDELGRSSPPWRRAMPSAPPCACGITSATPRISANRRSAASSSAAVNAAFGSAPRPESDRAAALLSLLVRRGRKESLYDAPATLRNDVSLPDRLSAAPSLRPVGGILLPDRLADMKRRIFGRIVRALAAGQAAHHRIEIRDAEEREGIALASRPVEDSVLGRGEAIIRPARHHVPDIDDEGAGDGPRLNPAAGGAQDLEPAHLILRQDGEGRGIGMGPDAVFVIGGCRLLGRIMDQGKLGQRLAVERKEIVLLELQSERKGAQEALGEPGHLVEIIEHCGAPFGHAIGPAVRVMEAVARADIRVVGRQLDLDLEGLHEVGCAGSSIVTRPEGHIAAILLRRAAEPLAQAKFEREMEEFPRRGKDSRDLRRGDAVICQIEEPDRLASLGDRPGNAVLLRLSTREEGREVDKGNSIDGQRSVRRQRHEPSSIGCVLGARRALRQPRFPRIPHRYDYCSNNDWMRKSRFS